MDSKPATTEVKLYIWREGVLPQYSFGLAVAAARSAQEAREAIMKRYAAEAEAQSPTLKPYWIEEIPKLREALAIDPEEVLDIPAAAFEHGSD